MDIFAHGMWAGAGAAAVNRRLTRTVPLHRAALWGVFPDLAAFTPSFLLGLWAAATGQAPITNRFFFLRHGTINVLPGFLRPEALYHFSHSLVFFALVFGAVWWLRRSPALAMLGWPLHILMDIPTHRAGRYGTPFSLAVHRLPFRRDFLGAGLVHDSQLEPDRGRLAGAGVAGLDGSAPGSARRRAGATAGVPLTGCFLSRLSYT
jgi:hypothetical protein